MARRQRPEELLPAGVNVGMKAGSEPVKARCELG